MRDETDTAEQTAEPAAEAPAPQTEPEPASTEPVAEPDHQTVVGHPIPQLTPEMVMQLDFIRDYVQGVPYAVDVVNAARAG